MLIRTRLLALSAIGAIATVLVGLVAWYCGARVQTIAHQNILLGVAIRHHLEADMMHDAIRGDTLAALLALKTEALDQRAQIQADFAEHVKTFQEALASNSNLELDPVSRQAINEVKPALDAYITSAQKLIETIFVGDSVSLNRIAVLNDEFTAAFESLEERNAKVSDLLTEGLRKSESELNYWESLSQTLNIGIVAIMLAIATVLGLAISRSVNSAIEQLVNVLSAVVNDGNFSMRIEGLRDDEIGKAGSAFNKLLASTQDCISSANSVLTLAALGNFDERISGEHRGDLGKLADGINSAVAQIGSERQKQFEQQRIAEQAAQQAQKLAEEISRKADAERHVAQENFRIRMALDSVSTNAMIADADGTIVYVNRSMMAMLRNNEYVMRQKLPRLDVNTLVGSSFDIFHANPSHQRNLLAGLQATYRAEIQVSDLTFRLTANPIIDAGQRLGTVLEWENRTAEVAIEKEIDSVVQAAAKGDFSLTLSEAGKSGFFLTLSGNLNRLITVTRAALDDIARVIGAVAEGELRVTMQNRYEGMFGQVQSDFDRTIGRLTETISEINAAADSIASGAHEIDMGTNDLSRRNEDQAASLEETASSMEQMTRSVQESAKNARDTSELVKDVKRRAEAGIDVVTNAVEAMNGIRSASKKIVDIVSIIDDIAFQTNLLALNAAVEASRAGEHGRGFAVVAGEVRNLAQHSSSAAKDIRALINDSVSRIEDGVQLVNETGGSLGEIEQKVTQAASMVESIANALREQAAGIAEVNKAIARIDEGTQQNAAMVEESSAAATSMSEKCDDMIRHVAFFKF